MIQRKTLLTLTIILLTGCASSIPKPEIIQKEDVVILATTDDHEIAYIKKEGDLHRICAARPTDSVATDESGVSLGLSGFGKTENVGEMSGRGELGLGGRSPAVLVAREFLFRACELSNNINADSKTTIDIYKTFLKSLEKITAYHFVDGTKSVSSEVSPYKLSNSLTVEDIDQEDSEDSEE